MYMYQYIQLYSIVLAVDDAWPASANRSTCGHRAGPFVAHDYAETLRIGCVCFGEETPKQRLKHSYPQERGEVYLFFSAFVKCSE